MSKLTTKIYDCVTGKTIERELTNDEFAQYKLDGVNAIAEKSREQAQAEAKAAAQAKLAALGLTLEDLQALGL